MLKIGLNEQDVQRIIDRETNDDNGLIIQRVNSELRAAQNVLHLDINKNKMEQDVINKEHAETLTYLIEKVRVLEAQRKDNSEKYTGNTEVQESKSNDILDIRSLCKSLNISGFDTTKAKYYMYENGIYDVKINEFRDTYSLKAEFDDNVNRELAGFIHTDGKKITFSQDIIAYLLDKKDSIIASISRYDAKKKQYKISRKNVAAKQVENYREEIKSICGTSSGEKWIEIYKVFSKTFPNFYKDYEKYKDEHHVKGEYDISKVRYVVEIMQQGNILLKIACELFVN